MKVTLLNFGLADRVIPDIQGNQQKITIGQIGTLDLHPTHVAFLTKAMEKADETMFIVAEDFEVPAELRKVAALLNAIDTQGYDTLLEELNKLIGPDADKLRPNRAEMRLILKRMAMNFIRAGIPIPTAEGQPASQPKPGRVFVKEEQHPDTPKQPKPTSEPKGEEMSEALRAALGEDAPQPIPTPPLKRVRATAPAPEPEPAPARRKAAKPAAKGKAKAALAGRVRARA